MAVDIYKAQEVQIIRITYSKSKEVGLYYIASLVVKKANLSLEEGYGMHLSGFGYTVELLKHLARKTMANQLTHWSDKKASLTLY